MPEKNSVKKQKSRKIRNKAQVAQWMIRGYSQTKMAEKLGVTQQAVSNYVKEIHEDLSKETIADAKAAQMKELRKLDEVEREAWEEWDRSKSAAIRERKGVSGDKTVDETTTTHQTGDKGYLDTIIRCGQRRCEILGLNAPDRLNVEGSLDVVTQEVIVSNREEVARMVTFAELTEPGSN